MALHGMAYRAGLLSSRAGAMPLIRVVVLALGSGLLPDVAGHEVRMALGYIILAIHSLVPVGLLLLPALYEVGGLATKSTTALLFREGQTDGGRPQVTTPPQSNV